MNNPPEQSSGVLNPNWNKNNTKKNQANIFLFNTTHLSFPDRAFVRAKDVLCFICFQTHFIGCETIKENVIEPKYKDKYRDVRRRNTLKKALMLQNVFSELFLHKPQKEIVNMLSQCTHNHYGQKYQPLTDDAKIMYEYLVCHNYNPYTIYKWFLIFLTEESIKEEIENNMPTQNEIKLGGPDTLANLVITLK